MLHSVGEVAFLHGVQFFLGQVSFQRSEYKMSFNLEPVSSSIFTFVLVVDRILFSQSLRFLHSLPLFVMGTIKIPSIQFVFIGVLFPSFLSRGLLLLVLSFFCVVYFFFILLNHNDFSLILFIL